MDLSVGEWKLYFVVTSSPEKDSGEPSRAHGNSCLMTLPMMLNGLKNRYVRGTFYVRRMVDLMKTAKVNAYTM